MHFHITVIYLYDQALSQDTWSSGHEMTILVDGLVIITTCIYLICLLYAQQQRRHLHKSRYSTQFYDKIRYLKVGLPVDWFHRHHTEPITEDLSLCKQTMLFVEIESENCTSTELRLKKNRSVCLFVCLFLSHSRIFF